MNSSVTIKNDWDILKEFTDARIALGRAGSSVPTDELLKFNLAHAQAQDAVHLPLDIEDICEQFKNISLEMKLLNPDSKNLGVLKEGVEPILLHSAVKDRSEYLQRPDLGRKLNSKSQDILKNIGDEKEEYDLSIVIVDGLSSLAIQQNAVKFIQTLTKTLADDNQSWYLSPISIVSQGRVAIGDEIGKLLNSKCVLILVGERPGLSSPDSLGLYLTYNPKLGLTDASRNCISNVRKDGLSYDEAVSKTMYLLKESRKLKLSGVNLKERTGENSIENKKENKNFLLA